MDKEKDLEEIIEADFTGHSEQILDKAVDLPPKQGKRTSGTIFSPKKKNTSTKKKIILVEYSH